MKISIIGTVGLPANYGGFETLVQNLAAYHHESLGAEHEVTVYCSSTQYTDQPSKYLSTKLRYVKLNANGLQSIPYDVASMLSAVVAKCDVLLILGVSGAAFLPFVKLFTKARIITNIDGIEWKRQKWKGFPSRFLHFSEACAIKHSDVVISDNDAIADYVREAYGVQSKVIAYGGDHVLHADEMCIKRYNLPELYLFSVCRIEPENNIHLILEAFSELHDITLVIVGNWNHSDYGRSLRSKYQSSSKLYLLDPIYDMGILRSMRAGAAAYVHGHSAGGTNPSLVEAMHFGIPVLAFDCSFNRATTESKALYFHNVDSLRVHARNLHNESARECGQHMREIANRRYRWSVIARAYFQLLTQNPEEDVTS